jgi:hypothetical protein
MDRNNDQKVGWEDLQGTLRSLNHTVAQKEVESMLWEVDDDAKGYLSAADFKASYYRIRSSAEQDEPRSWFRCAMPQRRQKQKSCSTRLWHAHYLPS